MHFPSFAILTLTALIAGELTANASDSVSLEGHLQGTVTQERAVSTPTVTPKVIESTAPVAGQKSSIQKPQALAVELQPLAAAIPQDSLVKEAKVLPKTITELSAVEVSYSTEELPAAGIFKAEALGSQELTTTPNDTKQLIAADKPATVAKCASAKVANPDSVKNLAKSQLLAQGTTEVERCPRPEAVAPLVLPEIEEDFGASPALSIYIPVGFGADNNTVFLTGSYQASVPILLG